MNDDLKTAVRSALEKTAINMLKDEVESKYISSVTRFLLDELIVLKHKI